MLNIGGELSFILQDIDYTSKKDLLDKLRTMRDDLQNYPKEEWKEIQNTDGKYYVSNCGRVKSLCGYSAIVL